MDGSLPLFDVVICSHNPRPEIIGRTIEHLKHQSMETARWGLLVVDNRSQPPLDEATLTQWHPAGRIMREEKPGLPWARYRALKESSAPWLVFVDDDNWLAPDYLERAAAIIESFPQLGAIGSAAITPEFEVQPEPSAGPYLPFLALRSSSKAIWSNNFDYDAFPCGAGLCIRRQIGLDFYDKVSSTEVMNLGRKGASLSSGDDTALVLAAIDSGAGVGVFPALRLQHFIPAGRVERRYLTRLATGISRSLASLDYQRGTRQRSIHSMMRMVVSSVLQMLASPGSSRFHFCILKGRMQAWANPS